MQIVSNTCVGARLYQRMDMKFTTPFTWNIIPYGSFSKICQCIRNINFLDVKFKLHFKHRFVIVEFPSDNLQIRYVHYRENGKYMKPTKGSGNNSLDILCKNIIDTYFKSLYERRVKRMDMNKPFLFILDSVAEFSEHPKISTDQIYDFLNLKITGNDKKILLTNDSEYLRFENENTLILQTNSKNTYFNSGIIKDNVTFKSWCQ